VHLLDATLLDQDMMPPHSNQQDMTPPNATGQPSAGILSGAESELGASSVTSVMLQTKAMKKIAAVAAFEEQMKESAASAKKQLKLQASQLKAMQDESAEKKLQYDEKIC